MLHCGSFRLPLSVKRPLVMGIVNLTPDSFSGDGLAHDIDRAIAHAHNQIAAGADILDIGAESSRPGAVPTPEAEELARLLPVLQALSGCGVPLSVDTYKPAVMAAALTHGASLINDIYGLRWPGAMDVVAGSDCAVCVMHMQGEPLHMQQDPVYENVVDEVGVFFAERIRVLQDAGIAQERVLLDPGFGFGKTLAHNLELFRHLPRLQQYERPLLVGVSRKSMLGQITGRAADERLVASAAAALLAAQRGAAVLRVHDVGATVDALKVWTAIEQREDQ